MIRYNYGNIVGLCPVCRNDVKEHRNLYTCRSCDFYIEKDYLKYWGGRKFITTDVMQKLLAGEGITLKNLNTVKDRRKFDCIGYLRWQPQFKRWGFDFVDMVWHD